MRKQNVLLYFGDHDPSGYHIQKVLEEKIISWLLMRGKRVRLVRKDGTLVGHDSNWYPTQKAVVRFQQ